MFATQVRLRVPKIFVFAFCGDNHDFRVTFDIACIFIFENARARQAFRLVAVISAADN